MIEIFNLTNKGVQNTFLLFCSISHLAPLVMERFMTLDLVNVMHDVAHFMGGVSNAWCIILRNMSNI